MLYSHFECLHESCIRELNWTVVLDKNFVHEYTGIHISSVHVCYWLLVNCHFVKFYSLHRPLRRASKLKRKPAFTEEMDEMRFWLTEGSLDQLACNYQQWRSEHSQLPTSLATSFRRVKCFCFYLAGGGYYRHSTLTHGVATSTTHMYMQHVVDYLMSPLMSLAHQYIFFPPEAI